MDGTMDLAAKTELELRAMERAIAKQHLDKFPFLSLAWGVGNLACWLAVWVLCLNGVMPLWLGFIIATVNVSRHPTCHLMKPSIPYSRCPGSQSVGLTSW